MSIVYDTSQRVDPLGERVVDFSPRWVLMFVRTKRPLTYDRVSRRSRQAGNGEAVEERGRPLIVTDSPVVNVTRQKGSCLKTATFILLPGEVDYQSQVFPGDWCFCWMLDNEQDAARLIERLHNGEAANHFLSGLKFVGRVNSPFRTGNLTDAGKPVVRYQITANGFGEFDASQFWDPYLANSTDKQDINTWMAKFGIKFNEFLSQDGIDINSAIPQLFELLLGDGASKYVANPAADPLTQGITGLTEGSGSAPFAFVVPETVGRVLGVTSRSQKTSVLACADIWTILQGIQGYHGTSDPLFDEDRDRESTQPGGSMERRLLWPASLERMLGSFNTTIPDISGKTVWSILSTYLNPIINEMYTALKPGPNGDIMPTLVVRQIPLSSPLAPPDKTVTKFLDVPRWKLPPQMVRGFHLGRSDALRINFVHLTGMVPLNQDVYATTRSLVNPATAPIRDDQDIQRSGLRPEISQVACSIQDLQNPFTGPGAWAAIRADIVMGGHLAFTGTIETYGIQEPIAEGDNFEWDGVVFHLEGVSHTGTMSEDGKKMFVTHLQVSHGMAADASDRSVQELRDNQLALYACIRPHAQLQLFEFGHTHETPDQNEDAGSEFSTQLIPEPDEQSGDGPGGSVQDGISFGQARKR